MLKLSKLSRYQKSYLTGAAALGGLGAAGGAFLQTGKTLRGDNFKNMSPEERRARIKRQRLIGAAGGAVRGLAFNHVAQNALLPSHQRTKDLAHIAGGSAVFGLGGGYADYKRLDDAAMRANFPKEPYESKRGYEERLKVMKLNQALSSLNSAIVIGGAGAKIRDDVEVQLASAGISNGREAYNRGQFRLRDYLRSAGSAGAGSAGAGSAGAWEPGSYEGARASSAGFKEFADDIGDLKRDLKKAKRDKAAAQTLRAKLKKAYRKAARTHHPDAGGDVERFKRLSTAYENIDSFLEKNSMWLRHRGFSEKIASAYRRRDI